MYSSTLDHIKKFLNKHCQYKLVDLLSTNASLCESIFQLSKNFPLTPLVPSITELSPESLTPFTTPLQELNNLEPLGKELLKNKEVLGILLAGGDGTRLGFSQPKGCFPISPYRKKSLFQLHAEKIVTLQKQLNCCLPLALLTSPSNERETITFFKKHHFFGLDPNLVFFLKQPTLPLYDMSGNWVFKNETELNTAPNGNGGLLTALQTQHECLHSYRYFTVTNIDNALASVYDIPLLNMHIHQEAEVTLRCFKQNLTPQNVGILVESNHRLAIVDYTSIKERVMFPYGNINTFCFSQIFLQMLIKEDSLPLHWIEKKGSFYDHQTKETKVIPLLKGEKFLSDTVGLADKAIALDSCAEDHFAPLKNLEGMNDVSFVQKALLSKDQKILRALIGKDLPTCPIELSMDFHYPDAALVNKCRQLTCWPSSSYLSEEML